MTIERQSKLMAVVAILLFGLFCLGFFVGPLHWAQ
jgi:hypothetical protein